MCTEEFKNLISTFCESSLSNGVCTEVVHHISNGKGSFLDLVTLLESLLTSPDSNKRATGTQLLADVLHGLPKDWLTSSQIAVIISFFVERMKDHHNVVPSVLHAATALMRLQHITAADIEKFTRALLLDVHCQSQLMQDRRNVYLTLRLCLTLHLAVVEEMFNEFVFGLLSAADGEKDPRNLLLVFSLVPLVATSPKVNPMIEDLFELIAAYFPIDYVPPVHDPFGVAAEDLVSSLRRCLTCTAAWAEYALPLLLEKMEADLHSAKLDAYLTLSAYTPLLNSPTVMPLLSRVWLCVRRDMVEGGGPHDDAGQAGLRCLTDVVAAAGRGLEDVRARDVFFTTVMDECTVHLSAPESRLWSPASALLVAVVRADSHAAAVVCHKVIPGLCEQLLRYLEQDQQEKYQHKAASNTIVALRQLLVASQQSAQSGDKSLFSSLLPAVNAALLVSLRSSSLSVVAEAVEAAHAVHGSRQWEGWPALAEQILAALLADGGTDDAMRTNALKALSEPFEASSGLLSQLLLPLLHAAAAPPSPAALDALVCLTTGVEGVRLVLPALWSLVETRPTVGCCRALEQIFRKNALSEGVSSHLLTSWRGVHRVARLMLSIAVHERTDAGELLPPLADLLRTLATMSSESSSVAMRIAVLLLGVLSPPTNEGGHSHRVTGDSDAETPCDDDDGGDEASFDDGVVRVLVLRKDASLLLPVTGDNCGRTAYVVFALSGLVCDPRHVSPLCESPSASRLLLQYAVQPSVLPQCRETAALLLGTLLNIAPEGTAFTSLHDELFASLPELLQEDEGTDVGKLAATVSVWGWLAKALEMRAAPQAVVWMEKLQSLLCRPLLGAAAAQCFEALLSDHPYAFPCARLLYKQRTFERIIGGLVQQFEGAAATTSSSSVEGVGVGERHCLLLAIAALLPRLPHSLLLQHLHGLVPVLLEGVRCTSQPRVVTGSVVTLRQLATAPTSSLAEFAPHAGALVTALLRLAASNTSSLTRAKKWTGTVSAGDVGVPSIVRTGESKDSVALSNDRTDIGASGDRIKRELAEEAPDTDTSVDSETVTVLMDLVSESSVQKEKEIVHPNTDGTSEATASSLNESLQSKCQIKGNSLAGDDARCHQPIVVREASLVCLQLLAKLPLSELLPYRSQVVRELKASVGDHKRVVRAAAAATRVTWLQLGT